MYSEGVVALHIPFLTFFLVAHLHPRAIGYEVKYI